MRLFRQLLSRSTSDRSANLATVLGLPIAIMGLLVTVSAFLLDLSGFSIRELLGGPPPAIGEVLSPQQTQAIAQILRAVLEDGEVTPDEQAKLDSIPELLGVPSEIAEKDILEQQPDLKAAATHGRRGSQHARNGEFKAARIEFQKATQLDPGNAQTWVSLGGAYQELGELEASEKALLHSIRLEPDLWAAHFNLGLTRAAQGQAEEAVEDLGRALELFSASNPYPMPPAYLEQELRSAPALEQLLGNPSFAALLARPLFEEGP